MHMYIYIHMYMSISMCTNLPLGLGRNVDVADRVAYLIDGRVLPGFSIVIENIDGHLHACILAVRGNPKRPLFRDIQLRDAADMSAV